MLKEKDLSLTGDDVREGLTAIISVKVPDQIRRTNQDKIVKP